MQQEFSEGEKERYESYLRIHLKNEQLQASVDEQIEALKKRDRTKWIHLIINIAAILLFGYSFYFDLTQLSNTFFIVIAAIFGINVILIFYQKNQIQKLIGYLSRKQHE